tara:strand:- start:146 stop:358 length:213 start_codon:yes stop_codon:yes gene_type:complete
MTYGIKDPFGFNKAINWDKLEDPEVLKELEKIFDEEKKPQATSGKQQAASNKLDKTRFRDYKGCRKEKKL